MRILLALLAHLLTTLAKLLGPGEAKGIVADSLIMKQQLLIINRSRQRAPNLTSIDRILLGFWLLFLNPHHIQRAAVILRPSTLLTFHDTLKKRKYRLLYSSSRKGKPGPKGTSQELILDVDEIKTVPYTPLSHPFVERLILTIHRKYPDHILFWNACDLERKLEEFRQYYKAHRVHTALDGDTPTEIGDETIIRRANLNQFLWKSHCRGLYQLPVAA